MMITRPDPQSGNVLFYIFIAVVLFGSLSFAVSQSGRESLQSVTDERSKLAATEIVDYAETMSKAIGIMRLRGTPLSSLRFSHSALPAGDYDAPGTVESIHEVFNTDGGAVVYRKAPLEGLKTTGEDYVFLNAMRVQDIGTTCPSAGCADLLMSVRNINETVCSFINRMADIGGTAGTPPTTNTFNYTSRFKGSMAAPALLGGGVAGKLYGCVLNTGDNIYYFYRVLWAQ